MVHKEQQFHWSIDACWGFAVAILRQHDLGPTCRGSRTRTVILRLICWFLAAVLGSGDHASGAGPWIDDPHDSPGGRAAAAPGDVKLSRGMLSLAPVTSAASPPACDEPASPPIAPAALRWPVPALGDSPHGLAAPNHDAPRSHPIATSSQPSGAGRIVSGSAENKDMHID